MNDKGSSLGAGLLLGAIVGLAIGFLYAPRPGEETREYLKEKTGDARHRAEEIIEEAREKAEGIIHRARVKADKIEQGAEESAAPEEQ